MADPITHLDWPFAFTADGSDLRENVQDTRADVLASVRLLSSIPQGTLHDNASVGIPDVAFTKAPVQAAIIEQALREQEDRAPIAVRVLTGGNEPQVVVDVDTAGLSSEAPRSDSDAVGGAPPGARDQDTPLGLDIIDGGTPGDEPDEDFDGGTP